ncbi:MAG: transposase [Atopobiaceae bacterium]|nr:transposase [Atopobiaceae bacterium]
MTKKKTYSPEFKGRIVRELVESDDSVGVIAAKYHPNANMMSG